MSLDKFIATEPLSSAGEAGEKRLWEAIQAAFASRECLAYWRYPIFSQRGQYCKEPDILIADREWGIAIVEVKAIAANQILRISGHLWEYQNFYAATGNPYQQAEHQLFALLGYSEREPSLKGRVSGRALVALPYITAQEWQDRGFDRLPANPPILFQDCLQELLGEGKEEEEKSSLLRDRICQTPSLVPGQPLTDEQWTLLLSILAGTPLYQQPSHPVLSSQQSRGSILQQARDRISQLDLQHERIAKQIPPGPQRLRGIPGSGKTVLLCQKAAHIHLKHPNWVVALVFFSRSLYPPILEQIDRWLRYFSQDEVGYDPKNRNLRVLHAWGSRKQPGFYSTLCGEAGVKPLRVNDLQNKQPNEALAEACLQLLQEAAIPQIFDAIAIDEGQDLMADRCKFEDKQPFYWLAYQALRPADPAHPEQRRLIWAYDEAQSLDSLSIPGASEVLGEKLGHLVTGQYRNGMNKTEILHRCYRTPHSILTAAHAIAMGWLRPGGLLTGMTRLEDWNAIGYEVKSPDSSHPNPEITLHRPLENSPNPIPELWSGTCIEFKTFSNRQQELSDLGKNIIHNLRYDGLRPSQEILVIVLGSFLDSKALATDTANFLIQQGIDIFFPSTNHYNTMVFDKNDYNPNNFWLEGAVTISQIHRAKGHEADMIYLIGLDRVAEKESDLTLRNQLLVALTRARGWVKMSGIGSFGMYREMHHVLQQGDTFTFPSLSSSQREIGIADVGELLKRYALGERNFRNIQLENVDLSQIDLRNANLIGANLRGAKLIHARLDEIKGIAVDLREADLRGVSLRKAKLIGANLKDANLQNADLSFADLSNADLSHAKLTGVDLSLVNLTDANLEGLEIEF